MCIVQVFAFREQEASDVPQCARQVPRKNITTYRLSLLLDSKGRMS